MLPFTQDQFFGVFGAYNEANWPALIVAYGLALVAVGSTFRAAAVSSRLASAVLSAMWLWTGVVYHGLFFAPINKAAFGFGLLFVAQAVAFAMAGAIRTDLRFRAAPSSHGWLGWSFILYSMLIYPVLGLASGHAYPGLPMFGVSPCPVTIFTFGMLMLTTGRVPGWLLAVPLLWSVIGGSAAILLGVPQDWILLISGILAVPLLVRRERTATSPASAGSGETRGRA